MEFSSLLFIYAFLPISVLLYYISPKKIKNYVLLGESLVFCTLYGIKYLIFILIYILWNFIFGCLISRSKKNAARILLTAIGIIADLTTFLLFRTKLSMLTELQNLLIPIGLCFLTLNAIGYLLDTGKGIINAEKNIASFALYIMIFTKLPMGPVVKYRTFSGQLRNRECGLSVLGEGIELFTIGLAKKVIAADNIYRLYHAVISMDVGKISALSAWLGSAAYILCLYFTLSGYSDMGAGLSRCFGFKFRQCFNYPCVSTGINDFCRNWHIPTVRWFDEYICSPLRKNKVNTFYRSAAFVMSWGLIGLWYDVRLTTFLWGILIGVSAVIEHLSIGKRPLKATAMVYTSIILTITSVFFFAKDLPYSIRYLYAMIGGNNSIADAAGFSLLKSYVVVLIVVFYISTGLFRNLIVRSKKKYVRNIYNLLSPFFTLLLLILCTAEMSGNGSSVMMLGIL